MAVPAPEALEVNLNGAGSRSAVKDVLLRSTLRLQSDEKLVELLRQGFAPAFDVMVERYRLPLTRYCARMVGPDQADDIVQDTFTASYTALGSDDRPIQLKPWLYRVAHNTAISALRKKGRHEHEELDENFDGVRQPHDQLEQSQRLHDLVANMRALPERQRTALVLQELEGMSPEEIAHELDGSVPMVRQLVHRARERLRNGVGMLIPLPLLLKLFSADKAAAATGKSLGTAAATTKSAGATGATLAGAGAAGTGAKLAVVLAVGALAGGGIAVERAIDGPGSQNWKPASADQSAGGQAETGANPARLAERTRSARRSSPGAAAATPQTNGAPGASDGKNGSNERASDTPPSETGRDSANDGAAPEDTAGSAPASGDGSGSAPAQQPAGESPSSGSGSEGSGSQPSGGSQPSDSGGGSAPSGGGGSTPSGGGGSPPSCKPVLGIPLPLICLGK